MKRISSKVAYALLTVFAIVASVSVAVKVHADNTTDPGVAPSQQHSSDYIKWSGNVDDKIDVCIKGSRVWVVVINGKTVDDQIVTVNQPLPSDNVLVTLAHFSGRGSVKVTQQPDSDNGYTAIVRVNDHEGGRGDYRFGLSW